MVERHTLRRRLCLPAGAPLLSIALSWGLLAAPSEAAAGVSVLTPPSISGSPQLGQTLTERQATWSDTPRSRAYQWEDCAADGGDCTSIDGASAQTYVVAPSDLGDTLRVQETAYFGRSGYAHAVSAPTAVASRPRPGVPTTTSLTSLQSTAVADQTVTLVATVTSNSAGAPPDGAVAFENGGAPISGCQSEPILPTGQSVTVTCQTTFAASVEQLTAAFTPASGSVLLSSVSSPESLTVGPDPTTTAVQVARRTVRLHQATTYTATVQPTYVGPLTPSQVVEFFDNGQPVPSCATQPLVWTGAAAVATCTVSFSRPGQHLITAQYVGDANFAGSASSPAQHVDGVKGKIHPTLSWTFFFTPAYTKILGLAVGDAPPGSLVRVSCSGRGCPMRGRTMLVHGAAHSAQGANLTALFRGRRLKPGTLIVVSVQRRGWIGKRYAFRVRAARAPTLGITCQAPGLPPGVGC